MTPTQQEIIELAREAGVEWQRNTTITGKVRITTCGSQPVDKLERFATLLLERFGAGSGEPVAYVCPTSHVTADGSMEDGPDYLEWADEASDYEKRVGTPLYTHPSPTDLRAEYERGLEDAAKVADTNATDEPYGHAKFRCVNIAEAIRALKGKQ